MITQQQYYFSENPELYGMLYSPEESSGAVLLIHPFGEEKKSAQRVLVNMAQMFASQGKHVLLFDLRGCGDSEGDMFSASLSGWIDDIATAANFLREHAGCGDISLVALRLGAYLSAIYQCQDVNLKRLILIEPILRSEGYLRELIRDKQMKELFTGGKVTSSGEDMISSLQKGEVVDINGYPITPFLYSETFRYDDAYPVETLIVSNECIEVVPVIPNGKLPKRYKSLEGEMNQRMHPIVLPPFWMQIETVDTEPLLTLVNDLMCNE